MTWGIFVNKKCKIPIALGSTEEAAWQNLYLLNGGHGKDQLSMAEFEATVRLAGHISRRIKIIILEKPRRFTRNARVGKYTVEKCTDEEFRNTVMSKVRVK